MCHSLAPGFTIPYSHLHPRWASKRWNRKEFLYFLDLLVSSTTLHSPWDKRPKGKESKVGGRREVGEVDKGSLDTRLSCGGGRALPEHREGRNWGGGQGGGFRAESSWGGAGHTDTHLPPSGCRPGPTRDPFPGSRPAGALHQDPQATHPFSSSAMGFGCLVKTSQHLTSIVVTYPLTPA